MTRVLLVGEANPYGSDPHLALYHLPRNASGNRLREHLGMTDHDYAELEKINLCSGRWSLPMARNTATEILLQSEKRLSLEPYGKHVVVMLGTRVALAFNEPTMATFTHVRRGDHLTLVYLPHPSGLNRAWNQPDARSKARRLLTKLAPDVAWGPTNLAAP